MCAKAAGVIAGGFVMSGTKQKREYAIAQSPFCCFIKLIKRK
ncbi:MAG: hypothetical protein JWQ57_3843 [Mucilaginibacter sp.]|nr:hypothetical protein [Mucilaginibacter sp.]